MIDIFQSAALRLTAWYLAIIMTLSIGTSLALYRVSTTQLQQNASQQISFFEGLLSQRDLNSYKNLRSQLLSQDRSHLKINLLVFNLFVLVVGGLMSYPLARRTLLPIEGALEAQKRFTADASHELRTPLTAIQTENEVALRDKKLTQKQAQAQLKSNLEEVAKLKALAEGLLVLANTEKATDFYQALSSEELSAQAIERVSKTARAKKIKIEAANGPDLSVKGSQTHLVDLLSILLDNAVKYSPQGSLVKIGVKKSDKHALISVSDRGPGIAAADLPHIFERFFRTDASRTKLSAGGYGLGLAIAKKIADTHKAYIEVKSRPGRGSTFTVHLPLA